ncbi:hypothetical protein PAPHI01_0905 [Pancytospora philotis]|nr:hypothetical protein PAPHI01_0905 [Pancytospora philotis]
MLPATIFWQLVQGNAVANGKVTSLSGIIDTDYTEFGAFMNPEHNTLEKRVLDQLWRTCIGYTSPEIPSKNIDAGSWMVKTDGKTCCLIYSVLDDTSQHEQPNRVLARLLDGFGFSGRVLLKKLFYTACSTPAAEYFSEARDRLAKLMEACGDVLSKISGEVDEKVKNARTTALAQHAEENETISNATDYVLAIRNRFVLNKKGFSAELSQLFDYWFNDYEYFLRHFKPISECISIFWRFTILPRRKLPGFKDEFARHIIDKEQPEYLNVLPSFMEARDVKQLVCSYFDTYSFKSFSPHFVINYLQYVHGSGGDPYGVASRTWKKYLEDAPTFLRRQTAFKDELFAKLPPYFLHEIFVHLKGLPANDPDRVSFTPGFVRKLDCALFLKIIGNGGGIEEQKELMDFMLSYLDDNAVEQYTLYVNSGTYCKGMRKECMDLATRLKDAINALAA